MVVQAEFPGVAKQDIDVSLDGGDLVIRGERRQESEGKEEHYYRMEPQLRQLLPSAAAAVRGQAPRRSERMATQEPVTQRTEGQGKEPEHAHEAVVHSHDHYHVSHHHKGGMLTEFEHRASWHTHEHNHNRLIHSHDYDHGDEEQHHSKEAHIHDHAAPADSPA